MADGMADGMADTSVLTRAVVAPVMADCMTVAFEYGNKVLGVSQPTMGGWAIYSVAPLDESAIYSGPFNESIIYTRLQR